MTHEEKKTPHEATPVETDPLRMLATAFTRLAEQGQAQIEESRKQTALLGRQVDQGAARQAHEQGVTQAQYESANTAEMKENVRVHAARTPKSVRLSTVITMTKVAGEPGARLECTATGQVRGPGEEHAGELFVTNVAAIDFGEGEAILLADSGAHYGDALAVAQREGDDAAVQQINKLIRGRGARGLQFRRATELHMPLIRRVVGKTVERLLSDGVVRVVEESAGETAQAAQ